MHALVVGKTMTPDGCITTTYKAYTTLLAPCLQTVYDEAFQEACLAFSLHEALLSFLNKPDCDPTALGLYCMLALLNTDYKILTKILEDRLAPLVPAHVQPDQNGYSHYLFQRMQLETHVI
ncbi:hypothetical protein NDU88_003720 [Pleurodeles waltl]|uniref:Uncharacterized protein n=1 Tax=Pleurodeles waltl TaxID=8319 RepID=A0AAV7T5M3_PLEWA|nr:hypothetical protein NDU88_003720 [Pleurodeles waltl]